MGGAWGPPSAHGLRYKRLKECYVPLFIRHIARLILCDSFNFWSKPSNFTGQLIDFRPAHMRNTEWLVQAAPIFDFLNTKSHHHIPKRDHMYQNLIPFWLITMQDIQIDEVQIVNHKTLSRIHEIWNTCKNFSANEGNDKQEAQLMLTTGSTPLIAVSRARAISDGTLT